MKKIILLILVTLVSTGLHSQNLNYNDTLVDGIDVSWSNDNLQIDGDTSQVAAMDIQEIVTTWIPPEPEPVDETTSELTPSAISQSVASQISAPASAVYVVLFAGTFVFVSSIESDSSAVTVFTPVETV